MHFVREWTLCRAPSSGSEISPCLCPPLEPPLPPLVPAQLGWGRCGVVYVESIARVQKLSLTGLILYKMRLADAFFVQWEELAAGLPRALYLGRLM